MKKVCFLMVALLLAGCVGSGVKAPVEEAKPRPVGKQWYQEEVCRGGLLLRWSDGSITYDKIPQKMMCPPRA
jgi:hypothetical protein